MVVKPLLYALERTTVVMTESMEPKTPRDSDSLLSEVIMPADANNHGTAFGGFVMALIDKAAGVCARRHSRAACVTASIDRIDFTEPIQLGELVVTRARIGYVGRTSMNIYVTVDAEDLSTGLRRRTNVCHLTFVALDEEGRPMPVPPLALETDEDHRIAAECKSRREASEEHRKRYGSG